MAPIVDGSLSKSTIPNAAFGAFIASISPARSVISSLSGPPTSAVLVVPEYLAKSVAALILPRASPSRASRKSCWLGVRVLVILNLSARRSNHLLDHIVIFRFDEKYGLLEYEKKGNNMAYVGINMIEVKSREEMQRTK